jgi:hypothetical protein
MHCSCYYGACETTSCYRVGGWAVVPTCVRTDLHLARQCEELCLVAWQGVQVDSDVVVVQVARERVVVHWKRLSVWEQSKIKKK